MKCFLKMLLVASCLGQSYVLAADDSCHGYWDVETKKLTPELLLKLHQLNLVYPNNASDADEVLQEKAYQSTPDFYKHGGLVQGWHLSYNEAVNFLNGEYAEYQTVQPKILPTHNVFKQGEYDLVVFMGNAYTSEKNFDSMSFAKGLGYQFRTAHFLFREGDEDNLDLLLQQYPNLQGENKLFKEYTVQTSNQKGRFQEANLGSLKHSGTLANAYMVVSPTIFFNRQSQLAQKTLDKQYLGGFSLPTRDWFSELAFYGYIKSFTEIFTEYADREERSFFVVKYLGNQGGDLLEDQELIKQAATIAWARSHVNMLYARAIHQQVEMEKQK